MRILMVTQWFDPEPAFKGLTFAKELALRGHQVEVLTGFPNYPGGKLYPGYRVRLWQREIMDGIPVLRVPLYPSHDRSSIGRALNYVSFALSASIGCTLLARPDVIYAYHPPATIGLPALVAKALLRAPVVYDIQDLWPDTIAATGMVSNGLLLRILGYWCRFVYRSADRLVVLSPGFKKALVNRGVPAKKIDVIYNWCNEGSIGSATASAVSSRFTVLFAGTMGFAQALDSVLEAANVCAQTVPEARFVFVGGGIDRDRLERRAAELNLKNVEFRPRVPMNEMGKVFAEADVLLVHLKNDPLFRITIPSKTQAYLAAGKPVLMAVAGDAADLIQHAGGGVACLPENPTEIASAVERLASLDPMSRAAMGKAGRSFYLRELSLAAGVSSFERVLSSLCHDTTFSNH